MLGDTGRNLGLFFVGFAMSVGTVTSVAEESAAAAPAIEPVVCAACHGPEGNSLNPAWPSLAGQHQRYIVEQLKAFKSGLRENASMSPQAAPLTDDDVVRLAAYFSAQDAKIGSIAASDVTSGQNLYRGGNKDRGLPACMACHGPNGAGNPGAGYPALRGQQVDYTVAAL